MVTLKLCPSCGNTVSTCKSGEYIENKPFTKYLYFVECNNSLCDKKPSSAMYSSEEFAIAAWNRKIK